VSFSEVLEQLPVLTFEQRQILIRRAVELDDAPLSEENDALIEERRTAYRANPESSVPLDEIKARLRARKSS
jgi:hypothetical protein